MNKDALTQAIALQRGGQLARARELTQRLLSALPDDVDVLQFAGQLELQSGSPELAIRLFDRALARDANSAQAHYGKGVALQSVNRLEEAMRSYNRALAIDPNHPPSHYNSGVLLQAVGRNEDAARSYAAAIKLQPDYLDALFNLGLVSNTLGRFEEAASAFEKLVQQAPHDAPAWVNYCLALYWGGKFERSLVAVERGLKFEPGNPDARCARAMVLEALGRNSEALRDYEQAFGSGFRDAQAFHRYGNLLLGFNRSADAVRALSTAAQLAPGNADILNRRGVALGQLGKPVEALADFRNAIRLRANFIEACANAAECAARLEFVDEALAMFQKALSGEAQTPSEIQARDRAVSQNIFFRRQLCLWEGLDDLERQAADRIVNDGAVFNPFKALISYDDPRLHRLCADRFVSDGTTVTPLAKPAARKHGDKIRLGYLSADFHDHATTRLMAELFELHDRSRFEIVAYSYGPDDGSEMRKRVVAGFDRFNDVPQLSDHQIAEKIAADDVHILVDLKGHTRDARLDILKYRPSPVQAHYLGYPGTLGGNLVDYIVADAVTVPFDQAQHYGEAIVHLPFCYQVNDRHRKATSEAPSRADYGLPENAFVLCGFAQPSKLSPAVFDVWARILAEIPHGVLWLVSYNEQMQTNLRAEITARGVAPERLIFSKHAALGEHLARHRLADLYLDTWPYGAHTSASDALWVDLPVITSPGRAFASRVSASLLQTLGVPELIARDLDDYARLAVRLARDPHTLSALRDKIRGNRHSSPLFDTDRFARGIEAAFLQMWEIHERGERPHSFAVAAPEA